MNEQEENFIGHLVADYVLDTVDSLALAHVDILFSRKLPVLSDADTIVEQYFATSTLYFVKEKMFVEKNTFFFVRYNERIEKIIGIWK